jgi:hypothetical protein
MFLVPKNTGNKFLGNEQLNFAYCSVRLLLYSKGGGGGKLFRNVGDE